MTELRQCLLALGRELQREVDEHKRDVFSVCIGLFVAYVAYRLIKDVLSSLAIPSLDVPLSAANVSEKLVGIKHDPSKRVDKDLVPCYDPATMQLLGHMPAMSANEVKSMINKAKVAAKTWRQSSFEQRRQLLRVLLKYIVENQETICKVAARDAGKALLDAIMGEVIVTCEKIHWLIDEGEKHLRPEARSSGIMAFYKKARVEYHPVGVVGAIVPWNYPFHNVLNPLTAALFAGNSLVVKVSEHASWSTQYYGRIISEALRAVGAPADLVQIVTGYGEAGNALVTGGCDKVIFVGSTQVGKKVMAAAADSLTPVVLELGGKDAVIVCDDADLDRVVPIAMKAAFLNCGQNCAGGERFIVHAGVYDKFVAAVAANAAKIRQGAPLEAGRPVDCGAMCMPGLPEKVQELVDDAVLKGARAVVGGKMAAPGGSGSGQFFPPTILTGITKHMKVWDEEIFGPVMLVIKVASDDEAVAVANDCPFGLGSNVFSGSQARARSIAYRLEAGMSSINDFATTYMCQSLPFGGVKHSGFDRFAGIEGLRGLCVPKAVAEDRLPWLMKSSIPPPWHYPVADIGFAFATQLVAMFYGPSYWHQLRGLLGVVQCFIAPGTLKASKEKAAPKRD